MSSKSTTYCLWKHKLPGLFMMIMLLWLTVSTPFVYAYQQEIKKEATQKQQNSEKTDDASNPLTTTNEEKSESGVNTLSEYLHDMHILEHHYTLVATFYKGQSTEPYSAFHPETISPPPNLNC